MKIVCFLFLIFFVSVWDTDASAQVVDMRAFSRQRGARAYRVKSVAPARGVQRQRQISPVAQNRQESAVMNGSAGESKPAKDEGNVETAAQTAEMNEYIQNNPHVRPDI